MVAPGPLFPAPPSTTHRSLSRTLGSLSGPALNHTPSSSPSATPPCPGQGPDSTASRVCVPFKLADLPPSYPHAQQAQVPQVCREVTCNKTPQPAPVWAMSSRSQALRLRSELQVQANPLGSSRMALASPSPCGPISFLIICLSEGEEPWNNLSQPLS